MRQAAVVLAAILAAGCSPRNASPPPASGAPANQVTPAGDGFPNQPTPEMAAQFPNCTWEEVRAAGFAMHSFSCPDAHVVADEALPGFQLVTREPNGGEERKPIVRIFPKAADAPIDAVLDAVRAASPGWATATCVLEPIPPERRMHPSGSHQLMPTGAAYEAWEAYLNLENPSAARPCGPMGPTEGNSRTFEIFDGAPDKVVFIDWSMESGQVYFPESLRVVE